MRTLYQEFNTSVDRQREIERSILKCDKVCFNLYANLLGVYTLPFVLFCQLGTQAKCCDEQYGS